MSLEQKIARLRETAARKMAESKTKKKPEPDSQLMLPLWPEEVRGIPNAVLRGALFTVSQEREHFKVLTPVAAVDGIEIRVQNARLNQHDLDLFEMLLHLQRDQPLGGHVEFTAHSLLKALGRGTSGKHHEELANDLARIMGSVVEIKWLAERKAFMGALLESAFRDDDTGRWVISFNHDTMKLYGQGHTWIPWEERKALGRNNIAKWLHGFYTTHAKPYAYSVDKLWQLCGSSNERKFFRRQLRRALDELVAIGALDSWEIDADDLVRVQRKPSKSQQKHLATKPQKGAKSLVDK